MRPTSRGVHTAESGSSLQISGEGSAGIFNDVLISENIRTSVISVSKLADKGIYSLFTKDSVRLLSADTGEEIASGPRDCFGLYKIPLEALFFYETARSQLIEAEHDSPPDLKWFRMWGCKEHVADLDRMTDTLSSPGMVSSEEVAALPGATPTATMPPVDERAKNIASTPSRKRREWAVVQKVADGQSRRVCADEAPPERPRWNSQSRLATATEVPRVRNQQASQSGLLIRLHLSGEFSATDIVNALNRAVCSDQSPSCFIIDSIDCPTSFKNALRSCQCDGWKTSRQEEITALWRKRNCLEVVLFPSGDLVKRRHFVFQVKYNIGWLVDRLKSRLIVDGSQQEGFDFHETFAPVVKYTSVRMFLTDCSMFGKKCHQLDVKNAFVNTPLDENVYVWPHPDMGNPPGHCIKLLRSLYMG